MTRWAQSRGTGSIALLRRTANYSEAGAYKAPVQYLCAGFKSFYLQIRLESFGGDKPDHLVEQPPRVFVLAVSVGQAKRRDDRASRAASRADRQRRVLVDPAEKDSRHHVVVIFGLHAFDHEFRRYLPGFKAEILIESDGAKRGAIHIRPVEIGHPIAVVTGRAVTGRDLERAVGQSVFIVRQHYQSAAWGQRLGLLIEPVGDEYRFFPGRRNDLVTGAPQRIGHMRQAAGQTDRTAPLLRLWIDE